ncbi:MAG: VOC family protein [Prochloron sp. SP5CPC1]|nr:VOC family protein [Candidatus Paraprochloron terpiosi SP5CPC1]
MMIKGIDHLDLTVGDLEAFITFFTALGFQVVRRTKHGGEAVELQYPGKDQPIIELHPSQLPDGSQQPLGLRHIAFKADDIDELAELVKQREIHSLGSPEFYEPTGRMLFSVLDPDGRKLQFVGTSQVLNEQHDEK